MLKENEVKLLNSFEVEELEERLEFGVWDGTGPVTTGFEGTGTSSSGGLDTENGQLVGFVKISFGGK